MAEPRYDRRVVQIRDAADFTTLTKRVNEALRQLSEMVYKVEGRSGETTTFNRTKIKADGYTLMDFENSVGGKGSISVTSGDSRTFCLAAGARRESDGQWVATDTGAVILEMRDDGTLKMYADTGLTVGAAYTPTLTITIPTDVGLATHGITSTYHTATGLTPGDVLTASGTNSFGWAAPASSVAAHGLVSTYHTVSTLTSGYVLTATATNSFGWAAPTGSSLMDVQVFTTTGTNTWTKPTSFTPRVVKVIAIGAGGGGGSGGTMTTTAAGNARAGGGGGGGGAWVTKSFDASDLAATELVIVGVGGAGGAAVASTTSALGNNGGVGGYSAFGTAKHTGGIEPVFAGGGGGGCRGAAGTAVACCGGSGGGSGGNGNTGTGSAQPGGYPRASFIANVGCTGNGGSQSSPTVDPYPAEYGGAGGAASVAAANAANGGCSLYGGGGGGAGGTAGSTVNYTPSPGGLSGIYNSSGGGGAAGANGTAGGAAPTAGTAGAAGDSIACGCGGGGGGASYFGRVESGAAGGAGGAPGGGGGGGGGCRGDATGVPTSGAGGKGGDGMVYVFTYG